MRWMRVSGLVVAAVAAVWFLGDAAAVKAAAFALRWNLLQLLSTDLLAFALLAAAVRLLVRERRRGGPEEPADEIPMEGLRSGKYAFGADPRSRRAGRLVRPGAALGYKAVRRRG